MQKEIGVTYMLRVKEIAKEKGITIADVAKRMGILPPALSRIINGSNTTVETLQRIADALEVTIPELFEEKKEISILIEYQGETKRVTESDIIKLFKSSDNPVIHRNTFNKECLYDDKPILDRSFSSLDLSVRSINYYSKTKWNTFSDLLNEVQNLKGEITTDAIAETIQSNGRYPQKVIKETLDLVKENDLIKLFKEK